MAHGGSHKKDMVRGFYDGSWRRLSDLYESLTDEDNLDTYCQDIIPDGGLCVCQESELYGQTGTLVYVSEDVATFIDEVSQYVYEMEHDKSGAEAYEEYGGIPAGECGCMFTTTWAEGLFRTERRKVHWTQDDLDCSGGTTTYEDDEEYVLDHVNVDASDEYGLMDDWAFGKVVTDDNSFDNLDTGEIGIMYWRHRETSYEDTDGDGDLDEYQFTSRTYSAVFDHDEPTFSNLEAVDATNYTVEPALDDVEIAGLEDLYGPSETSVSSLVSSYIESIADTIATAAGETGQPLNKIKYVQIDEDMFDAIGAEEGKETMAVETVKETTYEA